MEYLAQNKRQIITRQSLSNSQLQWHHPLIFLRSYGITADVLQRRPWEQAHAAMQRHLVDVTYQSFWLGFFYLASGKQVHAEVLHSD